MHTTVQHIAERCGILQRIGVYHTIYNNAILRGLATSNEGDAYSLQFTPSARELILNKFRFYNMAGMFGGEKNSSHYSGTAWIRTYNLPHNITINIGK